MNFTIRLNNGARLLKAEAGETLVQVLKKARLRIPSACGGRGRCGLCRVRIEQDLGPLNELEAKKITPEERAQGCHLSCQVKVDRDLDVVLPENLVGSRDYRARVTDVTRVTHDIVHVRMELLEPTAIQFKAGQFMEFETHLRQADGTIVCRTYSLASAPWESPRIEFMVRKVPGGLCSSWIFDSLKPGEELKLAGPFGEFHLNEGERDLIFIAGGSGMAPFASILKEMQHRNDQRHVLFFFGARSKRDLFYLDELAAFEKALPNVKFVPALSNPLPEDNWTGESGLITDIVSRHFADCAHADAYLCGSPGMIDACIKVLTDRGLPPKNIFFDKFT